MLPISHQFLYSNSISLSIYQAVHCVLGIQTTLVKGMECVFTMAGRKVFCRKVDSRVGSQLQLQGVLRPSRENTRFDDW